MPLEHAGVYHIGNSCIGIMCTVHSVYPELECVHIF